jgi:hypothetical protein
VFEGAGVFVEDGTAVIVGDLSAEASVTFGTSATEEGPHPVIQMTTNNKVKIREMEFLSLYTGFAFREGFKKAALFQSDVCFASI